MKLPARRGVCPFIRETSGTVQWSSVAFIIACGAAGIALVMAYLSPEFSGWRLPVTIAALSAVAIVLAWLALGFEAVQEWIRRSWR